MPLELPDNRHIARKNIGDITPVPITHIIYGQSSDVGMVRDNNQDSILSLSLMSRSADQRPDSGLFMVADGAGGHSDGEKASALAVRVFAAQVMSQIYLPFLMDDEDRSPVVEVLASAAQKANEEVIKNVPDSATTLTAVTIIGDLASIAHVGDSRCYLITQNGTEQITRDHSLVQRLIELGQITEAEALDHQQRNVLYRVIGQSETGEVDTFTRRLPAGSRLLLCCDGLWNYLSNEEIGEIVMSYDTPQEACDKLVELANELGGADNISVIVVKMPGN
jgi:PPM family protein phosphatase